MKYFEEINKKYGKFYEFNNYYTQCQLIEDDTEIYMNYYFKPINFKKYKSTEKIFNVKFPNELMDIYKKYNGFALFAFSFIVYGRQDYDDGDNYMQCDIVQENGSLFRFLDKKELENAFLVARCGATLLYYKIDEMKKIYCRSVYNGKLIHVFDSLNDAFDYYLPKLLKEYNSNGLKKHILEEDKDDDYYTRCLVYEDL